MWVYNKGKGWFELSNYKFTTLLFRVHSPAIVVKFTEPPIAPTDKIEH